MKSIYFKLDFLLIFRDKHCQNRIKKLELKFAKTQLKMIQELGLENLQGAAKNSKKGYLLLVGGWFGPSKKWVAVSVTGFSIYKDSDEQVLEARYSLDGAKVILSRKNAMKFEIHFLPNTQKIFLTNSIQSRMEWINFLQHLTIR